MVIFKYTVVLYSMESGVTSRTVLKVISQKSQKAKMCLQFVYQSSGVSSWFVPLNCFNNLVLYVSFVAYEIFEINNKQKIVPCLIRILI